MQRVPPREWNAISTDLRPVLLAKDTALFEPDQNGEYIYFPTDAVISFVGDTGDGGSLEVWSVGNEGVAGTFGVLGRTMPFRGVVQVQGTALMAKTSTFRRHFQKRDAFHDAFLNYYHYLLRQVSYIGMCNNSHDILKRFSRWLLMVQDRAGTSELKFTQDAIAAALGTRRATISVAAAALQSAGLIRYTPGTITIKSRKALLKAACRCYLEIGKSKSD